MGFSHGVHFACPGCEVDDAIGNGGSDGGVPSGFNPPFRLERGRSVGTDLVLMHGLSSVRDTSSMSWPLQENKQKFRKVT